MSIYKEIVQNECINKSTSKQMYSFGHDNRFRAKSKQGTTDNFYDLPSTRQLRSAGFGYGSKFDFASLSKPNPPPNTYNIKSCFELSKNDGKTMGTSRDKMKRNSILGLMNKNPGPGTYELKSTLSDIRYSMRPSTNTGFLSKIDRKNPGPGTYEHLKSVSKDGKFPISKFKTYGVPIIHPKKSESAVGNKNPGPGNYDPKDQFNTYVLSSRGKGNYGSVFSNLKRSEIYIRSQVGNPGPGSYRVPSDFGYYEKTIRQIKQQRKKQ